MTRTSKILHTFCRVGILGLTFLLLPEAFSLANELTSQECQLKTPDQPLVSLAALYRQDIELSYLKSICRALKKHKLGPSVTVNKFPYGNEESAFNILSNLLKDNSTDIILGPTDSGVFLRAIKDLGDQKSKIVVSPLVAANYDFNPRGFFFSTNVSINDRTLVLANTFAKYGLRSMAVLHSDTKFGHESEAAFREKFLLQDPKSQYRPLQYDARNFADKRPYLQIKQVLMDRPEGLGLFGTRSEIRAITELLSEMNTSLTPYRPIIFTPIDFRPQTFPDYTLYTVSLNGLSNHKTKAALVGDIELLTHDTTLILLDQLRTDSFKGQKKEFHNRLIDVLSGDIPPKTQTLTNMKFNTGRNESIIRILSRDPTGRLNFVTPPSTPIEMVNLKMNLLFDTRGWWMVVSLIVIVITPVILSYLDLKSWLRARWWECLLSPSVLPFYLFNVLVVGTLYVYLAETGRVPYDSPLTALVIAMGPTTFLKSTLFNTTTGKAIGLSNLYEKSIQSINRRLMKKKFRSQQKFTNILAYYNSLASLKDELAQLYSHARSDEEKEQLSARLVQDLNRAECHLEKRFVCARRLQDDFKWDNLDDFIPEEFAKPNPPNPYSMIKASVEHVRSLPPDERERIIQPHIEEAKIILERDYKNDKVNFPKDKHKNVFHCMRFLVQYGFYGRTMLMNAELLPKNWSEESAELENSDSMHGENRGKKLKLKNLVVHIKNKFSKEETNV
ncbi:MAG: ABC transporter substrate-binding protein [Nitrospirales bacterium]